MAFFSCEPCSANNLPFAGTVFLCHLQERIEPLKTEGYRAADSIICQLLSTGATLRCPVAAENKGVCAVCGVF
jgi:hypothetical protein